MRVSESTVETSASRRESPVSVVLPTSGVAVIESHHASSFEMPFQAWDYHKLCWVSMGKGTLEGTESQDALLPDGFSLLPAEWPHRFVDDPGDPFTLVIICFHPRLFEPKSALGSAFKQLGDALPFGTLWRGRNAFVTSRFKAHFREILREQARAVNGWEIWLAARLTQLLVEMSREAEVGVRPPLRGVALLDGVLAYLDANFREPVELDRVARRAGLSRRRFTELFRARTGMSLVAYVNDLRIRFACDRLRETGHIAYSCYESGFQDMAYFYRVFKKQIGQTPGAFVRKACSPPV